MTATVHALPTGQATTTPCCGLAADQIRAGDTCTRVVENVTCEERKEEPE